MSGDWYYNDLDSCDLWDGARYQEDEEAEDDLLGAWETTSVAYQTWVTEHQGNINMALNYIDANDETLDPGSDLADIDDFLV